MHRRQEWVINGRFMTQRMTGVQRYAYEIVRSIDEILSTDEDYAKRLNVSLAVPGSSIGNGGLQTIQSRGTRVGSGHLWDQCVLPWFAGDGVLSLGNFGPVLLRRHIVCIHDANTFVEPWSYSRSFRVAYQCLLPLVGRRASRVATVSQFSADMLVKFRICTADRIFIVPNGHEHALRWNSGRAKSSIRLRLSRPYVLLLGSLAKHKNTRVILEQAAAFDAAGLDIVVVGGTSDIFVADGSVAHSNVHSAGYVGDDDLADLYENAVCLAFPSRTEGFGIPPLEAMTRGCPVVSSSAASLVEVGGDAAIYIDPDRPAEWRDAIIALSKNLEQRARMKDAGRSRATLFSWKQGARRYLDEILALEASVAQPSAFGRS